MDGVPPPTGMDMGTTITTIMESTTTMMGATEITATGRMMAIGVYFWLGLCDLRKNNFFIGILHLGHDRGEHGAWDQAWK